MRYYRIVFFGVVIRGMSTHCGQMFLKQRTRYNCSGGSSLLSILYFVLLRFFFKVGLVVWWEWGVLLVQLSTVLLVATIFAKPLVFLTFCRLKHIHYIENDYHYYCTNDSSHILRIYNKMAGVQTPPPGRHHL